MAPGKSEENEKEMIFGRTVSAYRKVKTIFDEVKGKGGNIKGAMVIPHLNAEERADSWKEYVEGLYEGEELSDDVIEGETGVDIEKLWDPILEFKRALEDLRLYKVQEIDNIPSEILKSFGEVANKHLFKLVCRIYELATYNHTFGKNQLHDSEDSKSR